MLALVLGPVALAEGERSLVGGEERCEGRGNKERSLSE